MEDLLADQVETSTAESELNGLTLKRISRLRDEVIICQRREHLMSVQLENVKHRLLNLVINFEKAL